MDRYIKLITEQPIDKPDIKAWYASIVDAGPAGVIANISIEDDERTRHVVRLVHQVSDKAHHYLVPLMRDLLPTEVDYIVDRFVERRPNLDFDVETDQTMLRAKDKSIIPVDSAAHTALCIALAKQKHESWVRERTDAGWRYGTTFDAAEKTHPLLRPWDQLPERFRQPDFDGPQTMLKALNDFGYVVIPQVELQKFQSRD